MTSGDRPTLPPAQQEVVSEAERAAHLFNAGRVREALDVSAGSVQMARSRFGDRHPFVADMLDRLANLHMLSGDPGPAQAVLEEALELRREAFGNVHDAVAHSLNQLAILYTALRRFEDSERCYRECLDVLRTMAGDRHPAYGDGLANLASLYLMMRDDGRAEEHFAQALAIYEETLGPRHPDVAKTLQRLGTLAARRGAFEEAERRYRHALDILREVAGDGHPVVADALTLLEALYREAGDMEAAERLFEQAMAIRREALGPRHPVIADKLFDLASLHAAQADHAAAEPLLLEVLDIWKEVHGEGHPNVARGLRNLAGVYWATGDYARAERMEKQALDIERQAFGDRHPAVADDLNALGATYEKTGAFRDAEQMYLESLDIRRGALGGRAPAVAESLNNLSVVYLNMGRLEEAAKLCAEALDIRREVSGDRSQDVGFSLGTLGVIARDRGDYAQAEALAQESLVIARQMGDRHPTVLHRLNDLAYIRVATGRASEALDLLKQVGDIHDGYLRQVFASGSEKRRQAFLSRIETSLHAYLSLVRSYLSDDADAVRSAFDLVLRRKGIGAEAVAAERDAILRGRYPELAPRLKELALLRMEIAQAGLSGPGPQGPEEHERRLEELSMRKEALEKELARALPEVDLERQLRQADRAAVSEALPPGSALVELIQFHDIDFLEVTSGETRPEPRRRYLAFVLRAGHPEEVHMVDLGEAGPIDQRIAAYRALITGEGSSRGAGGDRQAPAPAGSEGEDLRAAVFDPLAPHLGDATRVFLAPDGDLTRLPFEVLPTAGDRLIERYTFSYLSTGRDVLRFGTPAEAGGENVVAAAPDFDLGGVPTVDPGPTRQSRDLDARTIHFDALAGTEDEGNEVASLLGATPWLGAGVLEARLKAAPSPRILHLATHGFFLPDQGRGPAASEQSEDAAGDGGPLRGAGMENPLLRSGLALAGANTFLRGGALPPEAEDGIITAEDVSGLDLLGTELVVLSACETGLGEIRVGEGVFGLRRAFVLAGARTLVMSLWKVPDTQSAELMQRFYANLATGLSRAEALRDAQLDLATRYPHPWFWGAFICQGDPGPLAGVGPG